MREVQILGIESSCDECSASVVRLHPAASPDRMASVEVRSVATFSQVAIHRPYGGVVPEIASRNHLETINHMIDQALSEAGRPELDAIAVTNRPGLVGALLVGVSAAKALAYVLRKPLVPVHHLEGHVVSLFLNRAKEGTPLPLPLLVAVVSGGHTNLYVMRTPPGQWEPDFLRRNLVGRSRDDAAGEAFDKTAKTLGFPYPGGAWIDREAKKGGNPHAFEFPRALPQKAVHDFSFSGLKTALALQADKLRREGQLEARLPDLCASLQEAIVDQLLGKIFRAAREHGCQSLAIVGGVAANSRLRARLDAEWKKEGFRVPPLFPESQFCTDNAAMIGAAGAYRFLQGAAAGPGGPLGLPELLSLNALSNPEL